MPARLHVPVCSYVAGGGNDDKDPLDCSAATALPAAASAPDAVIGTAVSGGGLQSEEHSANDEPHAVGDVGDRHGWGGGSSPAHKRAMQYRSKMAALEKASILVIDSIDGYISQLGDDEVDNPKLVTSFLVEDTTAVQQMMLDHWAEPYPRDYTYCPKPAVLRELPYDEQMAWAFLGSREQQRDEEWERYRERVHGDTVDLARDHEEWVHRRAVRSSGRRLEI